MYLDIGKPEKNAVSKRTISARLMQCGFIPGELVATRVEKASECPEIYVIVRKLMLEVSGNSRYVPGLVLYPSIRK
jgi:hypothetical protein